MSPEERGAGRRLVTHVAWRDLRGSFDPITDKGRNVIERSSNDHKW